MKLLLSLIIAFCIALCGYSQNLSGESVGNFEKQLVQNIKYPADARRTGIQGPVDIEFHLNANGDLTNFNVVKDIGSTCSKEVEKAIKAIPEDIRKAMATPDSSAYFGLEVIFGLDEAYKRNEPAAFNSDVIVLTPLVVIGYSIK